MGKSDGIAMYFVDSVGDGSPIIEMLVSKALVRVIEVGAVPPRWRKPSLATPNVDEDVFLCSVFWSKGPMGLTEFLVRKLEVVPSGSNNVPEAVGVLASVAVGESKGSLVSDELTSVRVGVVFGGTGVSVSLGELESSFFSSVKETFLVASGGEDNLGLRVVSASSESTVIVPELATVVPFPTSTTVICRTVEELTESAVTSAGGRILSMETSSGFPEKLGVGPSVENRPVGGSRGKFLAASILVRVIANKSAQALVGLSLSTASGGSAPDAMVVNAWFT